MVAMQETTYRCREPGLRKIWRARSSVVRLVLIRGIHDKGAGKGEAHENIGIRLQAHQPLDAYVLCTCDK